MSRTLNPVDSSQNRVGGRELLERLARAKANAQQECNGEGRKDSATSMLPALAAAAPAATSLQVL